MQGEAAAQEQQPPSTEGRRGAPCQEREMNLEFESRYGFEAKEVVHGGHADHRRCKSTQQFCCRQMQGDLWGILVNRRCGYDVERMIQIIRKEDSHTNDGKVLQFGVCLVNKKLSPGATSA